MRTTIIGGGPAGLTAAYEDLRLGGCPLVFESSEQVGGIARTECYQGYRFDIGGHRFYTQIQEIEQLWKEMLGEEMLRVPRLSRILYKGKFYEYPLSIKTTLQNLGIVESTRIVLSYLRSRVSRRKPDVTFEDWVTTRFGKRLFEIFFKTYTEKVWGIPCSEIRADWAAQRIKNLSMISAVTNAIFKSGGVKSLISEFDYPRLGPGQMWERFRDRIVEGGGEVELGKKVCEIRHDGGLIDSIVVEDAGGNRLEVDVSHLISSMPITKLVKGLRPIPPSAVIEAADGLKYRDFLIVPIIIDDEDLFPDNWIYIHTPEVRVGRIQNFKNWSEDMVPDPHKTCLGMEYFCNAGDDLWSLSDAELVALAKKEIAQLGLAQEEDVIDGCVIRQRAAYPVYDADYRKHLETIKQYLESFENLQVIGRNGMHRYNNQDHSMLCGLLAARNIRGAKHDLWEVNTERSYYEEQIVRKTDDSEPSGTAFTSMPESTEKQHSLASEDGAYVGEGLNARVWPQVLLILSAWLILCLLQLGNDGLWMSDASRHAANGLFWKDVLRDLPSNPKEYALEYYARYPVIKPTVYPPIFYLIEAAGYQIFGPSPMIAKSIVLLFTLGSGLYTAAWLRRWVNPSAGIAGCAVMLTPTMVMWSHAVMPNVPGFTLGLAALYHARRVLDDGRASSIWSRHGLLAAILFLSTFFTYYSAAVVLPVLLAWILFFHGSQIFRNRWMQLASVCGGLLLIAVAFFSMRYASAFVTLMLPERRTLLSLSNWTYYLKSIPTQFGWNVALLAGVGLGLGLTVSQYRREAMLMAWWVLIAYLFFSIIRAREPRYLITVGAPLVILAAIGIEIVTRVLSKRVTYHVETHRIIAQVSILLLVTTQIGRAAQTPSKEIHGVKQVVEFLERTAPGEAYFYDGDHNGIFTYYVRAGDPDFRCRVVIGQKLLYAYAQNPSWMLQEYISTPEEAIERMRERGGFRWLAVETNPTVQMVPAGRALRKSLHGPEFELVGTYPVTPTNTIELYRMLGPLKHINEVELPFPILGSEVVYRVRPIPTRESRHRNVY